MPVTHKFATEIETHVLQLREEGWSVIPGVIPEDEVGAVREEVDGSQGEYRRYSEEHGKLARNVISFMPSFAAYLADERVLGVVKALLDPHVRINQTEYKSHPAHFEHIRSYHSDFPYDHLATKNPRGKNDGIDGNAPIPNEFQVTGSAGSVLVFDSRIWHSQAANPSDQPRTAVVVRYAPWWLNLEFIGVNQATVPAEVFDTFPEDVKVLYEHRVEGRESAIWA